MVLTLVTGEHLTINLNNNGNLVPANVLVGSTGTTTVNLLKKFKVPVNATIGVGSINATGTLGLAKHSAVTAFTVSSPTITALPLTGGFGASVTVHGTNFVQGEHLTINLNNNGNLVPANVLVGSGGIFTQVIKVPANATTGVGSINATGTLGLAKHSAVTAFTVSSPTITALPLTGGFGASVTVHGTNFVQGEHLTIKLNNNGNLVPANVLVGSGGIFTQVIKVPANATTGVGSINATGTLGLAKHSAVTPFTVGIATISMVPDFGPQGASFTVTGSKFAPSTAITIHFGAKDITPSGLKSKSDGTFSTTVAVPQSPFGTNVVTASDGLASASVNFFKLTPSVFLSRSTGPAGTTVALSGFNFIPLHKITVADDGDSLTTIPPAKSAADGSFTVIFTMPSTDDPGDHAITASDGLNKAHTIFTTTP